MMSDIAEHLGFVHGSWTTRRLRPQIDAFIERRLPSLVGAGQIEDERILARAYRRLRRAGFSSGGSLAALKRMAARPELIEEPPPEDLDE